MFYAGIVMLGIVALLTLTVDFLPAIDIPRVTVQTSYTAASPEEVEDAITRPIESAVGTVEGVRRIRSVTREGMSIVTVEFAWGTGMDFAVLEMREKLDQVRGGFPRDADRPTILRIDPSVEPIMTIALSSPGEHQGDDLEALAELKETARSLVKRRIEQVKGVAQAAVLGGAEREIHVDVRTSVLQALGVTIGEVSEALSSGNINLPGGTIKHGLFRYSLRTLGEFTDCDDIRNTVIRQTAHGRPIKIQDIATVRDTHRERSGLTRYNGHEVIILHIRKEAGANTVAVSRSVHIVLEQLRREYPSLSLDVIADHAEFISQSVSDVQQAILIGALLALAVLFIFLRRPGYLLMIGVTMPVSILATILSMHFLGINLNIISLTGLALGIGMLGDNAIVLVENVTRLREGGRSLLDATLEGAEEIGTAVTASTLTNVAIFIPIVFVEGVAAQLFVDMGITMSISLMVSLLVAVTLVPMLVSRESVWRRPARSGLLAALARCLRTRLLQREEIAVPRLHTTALSGLSFQLDRVDASTRTAIEHYLSWALGHRMTVLVATAGFLLLSVLLALLLPAEPAPDIDQSRFVLQIRMPRGTSLAGLSTFAGALEGRLTMLPGVKGVFVRLGVTEDNSFWNPGETLPETALLEVSMTEPGMTAAIMDSAQSMVRLLSGSTVGIEYTVRSRGTAFEQILRPERNDITCRITGRDPSTVERIAAILSGRIRSISGLVDLRVCQQEGTPEYQLTVDREAASLRGLSVHAVATHLIHQVRGQEATAMSDFDRKVPVRVLPSMQSRNDIAMLLASTLPGRDADIPVRSLVTCVETEGLAEIWRENQQRTYVLTANVNGRSLSGVVTELNAAARALHLPPGYAIRIGGENEEIRESFEGLLMVILLSLFLVFMILAAEYESILYPLVILLTSPLAFIGAMLAMVITGQSFNVMSLVGLVVMIGAVDNDAVILVDQITDLRRAGTALHEAIQAGMRRRLRPILMTTATTVLGVIPLVFPFGTGSELVRALTTPLVGGLIASTIFTVTTIPVVYACIDRWGLGRTRLSKDESR